jgi:membrane associated rhomboid family serine protease
MMLLLALLAVGGVALYVMSPEERVRLLRRAMERVQPVASAATPRAEERAFREALRARTSVAIVTPLLVFLNIVMFIGMLFGSAALSDPNTLIAWGANFAPRTTNGEWWRLVASMFVHAGFVDLALNTIGLAVVGLVLERLVGHVTFAVVYVAAGIAGGLASLFAYPLIANAGATASVLGVYGLLLATSLWGLVRRSPLTIPLAVVKRLGPLAALFVFYVFVTGRLGNAGNMAGLVLGVGFGLVLTRNVSESIPSFRPAAAAMAATLAIAVVCTVPLRGIADVGPSIAQVVAAEDRTAKVYQHAVSQFVKGRATAEELAGLIEDTILPDLQSASAPLQILGRVAREQQPLVADAGEYVRFRNESWQLRADGLRAGDMRALKAADKAERAALTAFERIRPSEQK